MPVSVLYKNLKKRISSLKKQFLSFNPSDSLLPQNQDNLRAFKLLVHTEIESYIENSVLAIWNKCENEWKTNKRVITPLVFLVMFSTSRFEADDKNNKPLTKDARISQILMSFKSVINDNNGIKKKNILKLVIPFGVDYSHIDQTWLSTIDSYGSSRGEVAHKSFAVQQPLDKNNELKNLDFVLKGLSKIDLKIQKTSSTRRRPL
jgi:hypothetical protein